MAIGGAPSGIDPTARDVAAADPGDEVLARRLRRHHVLELPAEETAVEVGRGLGIWLAGVDPARDAGDVSVSLGHCWLLSVVLMARAHPTMLFRSGSVLNFGEDEIDMTETSGRLLEMLSLLQARREWPGASWPSASRSPAGNPPYIDRCGGSGIRSSR